MTTMNASSGGSNPTGEAVLAAARGSTACHECKRDTTGEMTWPGEAGHEVCQECWEAECSRSWWKAVEEINRQMNIHTL